MARVLEQLPCTFVTFIPTDEGRTYGEFLTELNVDFDPEGEVWAFFGTSRIERNIFRFDDVVKPKGYIGMVAIPSATKQLGAAKATKIARTESEATEAGGSTS